MAQTKVIKQIEEVEGGKGTYLKVHWEDGKAQNFFQEEHQATIREIGEGNPATYEVKKEGQFWNVTSVRPANLPPKAPETLKEAIKTAIAIPDKQQSYNEGAARGMCVKEIGDMIRASNEKELKFVALVFGEKAPQVIEYYRAEILKIAGIK